LVGSNDEEGVADEDGRLQHSRGDDDEGYRIGESVSGIPVQVDGSTALFNAMHMVADYGSLLTLARISEKAAIGTALSATERNILSLARISEEDAVKIGKLIGKHGSKVNGVRYLNFDGWEDAELAFRMQHGANNVTMNSILLPGSEVPKAVRTPLGELIFQYKKFFCSAIDRCFLPAINRLAEGELSILSRGFLMVMMGRFKEQLSRMAGLAPSQNQMEERISVDWSRKL
jgi:hypothetical protein